MAKSQKFKMSKKPSKNIKFTKQKQDSKLFYSALITIVAVFAVLLLQNNQSQTQYSNDAPQTVLGERQNQEFVGAVHRASKTPTCSITSPPAYQTQTADFTATITYTDPGPPIDTDTLSKCDYRIFSNGALTKGWTSAGSCSGVDSRTFSVPITVGPGKDCRDNGPYKCAVQCYVRDSIIGDSSTAYRYFSISTQPTPTTNQPPSVTAVNPSTGTTNQPITFTATATDPNSDPIQLRWSCDIAAGWSNWGANNVFTYTCPAFTTAGTKLIRVQPKDSLGAEGAQFSKTIAINPPTSSCTDECSQEGAISCVNSNTQKRCIRNADSDSCLEWGQTLQCPTDSGYTCVEGQGCVPQSSVNHPPIITDLNPKIISQNQPNVQFTATATDQDNDNLQYNFRKTRINQGQFGWSGWRGWGPNTVSYTFGTTDFASTTPEPKIDVKTRDNKIGGEVTRRFDLTRTTTQSCIDECSPSGKVSCINSNTQKTCGNFDSDNCLEWGQTLQCPTDSGYTCVEGQGCVPRPNPQCSDGIDNDGDGSIDLQDFGCHAADDGDERNNGNTQCSDGIDNDQDLRADQYDPGCQNRNDNTEADFTIQNN